MSAQESCSEVLLIPQIPRSSGTLWGTREQRHGSLAACPFYAEICDFVFCGAPFGPSSTEL